MIYKLFDNVKFYSNVQGSYLEREDTGERFNMGGIAADIIELIDGKRDMNDILEELCKLFGPDVDPLMIAGDLERFMGELAQAGLVELVKDPFEEGFQEYMKMRDGKKN